MGSASLPVEKPRLRGQFHQAAFFAALGAGGMLIGVTPSAHVAGIVAIYAASLAGMFGVSALYHRPTWSPRSRAWMRRLDHSMIFLLIAGTYTPLCLLGLDEEHGYRLLTYVWVGAIGGVAMKLLWVNTPRWLSATLYVALGWIAVTSLADMRPVLGTTGMVLLVSGGALYTIGAVVYAARRPDPAPSVFGYHEIFHLFVVAAALCHFIAVARVVLMP